MSVETIFNSTAKHPSDLLQSDADLSTISSIDFNADLGLYTQGGTANFNIPPNSDANILEAIQVRKALFLIYVNTQTFARYKIGQIVR